MPDVGEGLTEAEIVTWRVAAEADGHDLEVIDLRTLSPLDLDPVVESVRRTGRLVVVAEAPSEVSVSSEVAARVQELCFHFLEAPVLRVTGFDTPYPPSKCEEDYLPAVSYTHLTLPTTERV